MAYNIRAKLKIKDLGDTKPVAHTFFTSDDREPAVAKAQFEQDNKGARDVELFRANKPCPKSDFDRLLAEAEAEDKITLPAPAPEEASPPQAG